MNWICHVNVLWNSELDVHVSYNLGFASAGPLKSSGYSYILHYKLQNDTQDVIGNDISEHVLSEAPVEVGVKIDFAIVLTLSCLSRVVSCLLYVFVLQNVYSTNPSELL